MQNHNENMFSFLSIFKKDSLRHSITFFCWCSDFLKIVFYFLVSLLFSCYSVSSRFTAIFLPTKSGFVWNIRSALTSSPSHLIFLSNLKHNFNSLKTFFYFFIFFNQ